MQPPGLLLQHCSPAWSHAPPGGLQVGEAGNNNPSLDELHTEDAAQEDDMHGNNDSIMDAKKVALRACCLLME